jgi:hypothetical protein
VHQVIIHPDKMMAFLLLFEAQGKGTSQQAQAYNANIHGAK